MCCLNTLSNKIQHIFCVASMLFPHYHLKASPPGTHRDCIAWHTKSLKCIDMTPEWPNAIIYTPSQEITLHMTSWNYSRFKYWWMHLGDQFFDCANLLHQVSEVGSVDSRRFFRGKPDRTVLRPRFSDSLSLLMAVLLCFVLRPDLWLTHELSTKTKY